MSQPRSGLLYAPNKEAWMKLFKLFEPLIRHTQKIDQ
jgi:hypothetical protein